MPIFKCSLCDYQSDKKSHVERHFSKQNKCGKGTPTLVVIDVEICCDYCEKKFSTKPNLTRHLKICKVKKEDLQKQLEIKDKTIQGLEKRLAVAEALAKKPTTVNNNININLTPWYDPKLPPNIEEFYAAAVKKLFLAVPSLIKMLHFNEDLPENHTICISNASSGLARVYNGKEWESINEKQLIQRLVNDYEATLEEYAEEKYPKYIKDMASMKRRVGEETLENDLH